MSDLTAFKQVLENWRREKVTLFPPNNEAEIILAFEKVNRKCSADIIALYCVTGGMDDGELDSNGFAFWSLEKIIEKGVSYKDAVFVAFGDFLIESHAYYFHYEDKNKSSVYTDWSENGEIIKVADSINNFFELCLYNSEQIGLF